MKPSSSLIKNTEVTYPIIQCRMSEDLKVQV